MAQLALDAVTRLEKKFGLIVAGLVTDNASNMSLMREKVQLVRPLLFTFPCQAHCLNLLCGDLVKDKGRESVVSQVVGVLKVFKTAHPSVHP